MDDRIFTEVYSDADIRSFQRVGEFLCWFAKLEIAIDQSIVTLLGLEQRAGDFLLAYVPFGSKREILRELVTLSGTDQKKSDLKAVGERLEQICRLNHLRNTIAHSFFVGKGGAVQFMKGKKTLASDKSKLFDDGEFQKYRSQFVELEAWIIQITHRVAKSR